jgi:hypothetical protein
MKGVTYVTDDKNRKVAVQIELKLLEKYDEEIEDLIDGIIAESRKTEERVPLDKVIKGLKRKGKRNEALCSCISPDRRKRIAKTPFPCKRDWSSERYL